MAINAIKQGHPPSFCCSKSDLALIDAETVANAAVKGDPIAVSIFETVGHYLGRGLALLVDILNPERIIIGSIYSRQRDLLESTTLRILKAEALPQALAVCQIVPSSLGEQVGDMASLAVAQYAFST
jgi:glucokinase